MNRIKLSTSIILAASIALVAQAQTETNTPPGVISGPGAEVLSFLGTASNLMVVPFGTYSTDNGGKFGGGIALAYKASDFVCPMLRFDYLDKQITMPSAALQLQLPVTIAGKITVIPFAFSGVATPISGKGNDNGAVSGMFGAGAAVRISSRFDLVGDIEKWTGFKGQQYRFGVLYKF